MAVRTLQHGSQETSSFLHACASFGRAHAWNDFARKSWRKNLGNMVRIALSKVGYEIVIDQSSQITQKQFFNKRPHGYSEWVRQSWQYVPCVMKWREVGIMFRGKYTSTLFML